MRIFFVIFLGWAWFHGLAQPDDMVLPIQHYSEHGDRVPIFLDSRPNPSFWRTTVTRSFAERVDHTAAFDLTRLRSEGWEPPEGLVLTLINPGRGRAAVVVAAEKGRALRKHLVGVDPYSELSVDIRNLANFDALYFVSIAEFSAVIETSGLGNWEVDVERPQRRHKSLCIAAECAGVAPSCRLFTVENGITSGTDDAYFERVVYENAFKCPDG
jgi:hypothetical protein